AVGPIDRVGLRRLAARAEGIAAVERYELDPALPCASPHRAPARARFIKRPVGPLHRLLIPQQRLGHSACSSAVAVAKRSPPAEPRRSGLNQQAWKNIVGLGDCWWAKLTQS